MRGSVGVVLKPIFTCSTRKSQTKYTYSLAGLCRPCRDTTLSQSSGPCWLSKLRLLNQFSETTESLRIYVSILSNYDTAWHIYILIHKTISYTYTSWPKNTMIHHQPLKFTKNSILSRLAKLLKLGARLHRNGSLQQTGSHSARPCRSLATDGKHEDVSYPRLWSACGQHTALPFGKVPKIRKRETNKGKTSVSLTCTLKGMNWMNWSLKTFNFDGGVITCLYNIHARSMVFQSIGLTCPGRK